MEEFRVDYACSQCRHVASVNVQVGTTLVNALQSAPKLS